MDNAFGLLEEKVRKAADLVKALRLENRSLEEDLVKARGKLHEAEKRLDARDREAKAATGSAREIEPLQRELKALQQEREEVRARIAKLLEVLNGLD
jgi:chromosome segregation ATPase